MESHYDVEVWADGTTLGRRVYNHAFRMFGQEAPGWSLVKTVAMHRDSELVETVYLWRSDAAEDRELVRVSVAELSDWRLAQQYLAAMLDHCMRPGLAKEEGALAAVGDVAIVARAPESDIPTSVQFARGNVAVAVHSAGSAPVDVSPFAAVVDRMLSAAPTEVDFLRPHVHRVDPAAAVGPGGKARLATGLDEAGGPWLHATVPAGVLRREGGDLLLGEGGPGLARIYTIDAGSLARPEPEPQPARIRTYVAVLAVLAAAVAGYLFARFA